MSEGIFTDEELTAFKRRVWVKSQEQISNAVEYAITEELRAGARTELRRFINTELRGMIKPRIEARRQEIEARLDYLVSRAADLAGEVLEQETLALVARACNAIGARFDDAQHGMSHRAQSAVRTKLLAMLKEEQDKTP